MWIKDFVSKHPDIVVRGSVPYCEIVDKIKQQYDAVEIPLSDVPSMRMHRYNAVNLPANEALGLTEEQLEFKAVKIPIDNKSLQYTTKDYVSVVGIDGKEFIYLIFEERVRYHYSNSNRLFLEVAVSRGIPESDIENETEDYLDYLFCVKCLLAHTHPDVTTLISYPKEDL